MVYGTLREAEAIRDAWLGKIGQLLSDFSAIYFDLFNRESVCEYAFGELSCKVDEDGPLVLSNIDVTWYLKSGLLVLTIDLSEDNEATLVFHKKTPFGTLVFRDRNVELYVRAIERGDLQEITLNESIKDTLRDLLITSIIDN